MDHSIVVNGAVRCFHIYFMQQVDILVETNELQNEWKNIGNNALFMDANRVCQSVIHTEW